MQLFSIGLYQLDEDGRVQTQPDGTPTPTYGFADIKTFARVFTGYGYFGSNTPTLRHGNPIFSDRWSWLTSGTIPMLRPS